MGLGPPVCEHCQVIGMLDHNNSLRTWYCPICGNSDLKDHAGLGDWTKYEQNLKFFKFMKGELEQ